MRDKFNLFTKNISKYINKLNNINKREKIPQKSCKVMLQNMPNTQKTKHKKQKILRL